MLTKPLTFDGTLLELNFATSAAGSIRVEIQAEDGKPISGFSLEECPELFGDSVMRTVVWNNNPSLSALAGKSVRLLFELKDADLYSFQFTHEDKDLDQ